MLDEARGRKSVVSSLLFLALLYLAELVRVQALLPFSLQDMVS